jgi:hypothetical protein
MEHLTKTPPSLCISRVKVSNVMSAYMNHVKKTSVKSNNGQKSTLTERDHCTMRRTVSKNHIITAAQVTAELNIHLEDPISTQIV